MWQPGSNRPLAARLIGYPFVTIGALALLVLLLAIGMAIGIDVEVAISHL